ncbi:MAG TPA: FAD-binding oxidoreductase [Candidatus Limnocylindrales bacterium]|nr:FAD-binding oxidoreductase [Candidatus Limnocylindrales bacterium]
METADLVVIGAGTLGGWASVFAREDGAGKVIVLDAGLAGQGASSRASGIVRQQGGIAATVALGRWSVAFYRSQADRYGTDSGFRETGYHLLAVSVPEAEEGRARVAMQRAAGLDVEWLEPAAVAVGNPTIEPASVTGASWCPTDGCIDPPRNVRAYSLAMQQVGVDLRERTPATEILAEGAGGSERIVGVATPAGRIATDRVLMTGGPTLRGVGELVGLALPVGPVRHMVAVTEPIGAFDASSLPMAYAVAAGVYWRPEEGGLLFGASKPDETPGEAIAIDFSYLDEMRATLARHVPATAGLAIRKAWAATIEYSPDHLPIVSAALRPDGAAIGGLTIASACGHGMMWGPGIARVAVDLALRAGTDLADLADLALDRFDAAGRSRLAPDRISLPLPTTA